MAARDIFIVVTAVALLGAGASLADTSPYTGLQERPIKALSDQQIDDLREGRGMGLALPAELNGYPGPRHVLGLAGELGLSPEQHAGTEALYDEMLTAAAGIGERIIAGEAALNDLFSGGSPSEADVYDTSMALGRLQGELRALHLGYHLAMRDLLTPHQTMLYQQLRGYLTTTDSGHASHGGQH